MRCWTLQLTMSPWLSLWVMTIAHSLPLSQDSFTSPGLYDYDPPSSHLSDTYNDQFPSVGPILQKYLLVRRILEQKDEELREEDNRIFETFCLSKNNQNGVDSDESDYPEIQTFNDEGKGAVKSPDDSDSSHEYYQPYQECRSGRYYSNKPLRMVAVCPKEYTNTTIRRLCEFNADIFYREYNNNNRVSLPRLPTADAYSHVFANRFCAQCHNVSWTNTWQFEFECDTMLLEEYENIEDVRLTGQMLKTCGVKALPPFQWEEQGCKNVESFDESHRSNRERRSQEEEPLGFKFPVSFSILMNFGFDGKAHILFSEAHHTLGTFVELACPENQIFDPEKHICRPVVCDNGYVLRKQKCIKISPPKPTPPTVDESLIADDVANVSLEVNVSIADYFLLFSKEFQSLMVSEIGNLFNISVSRIQNFTIQPLKGPGSGNMLEIHKYKVGKGRSRHWRERSGPISDTSKFPDAPTNNSSHMDVKEYMAKRYFLEAVVAFLELAHKDNRNAQQNGSVDVLVNITTEKQTLPTSVSVGLGLNFTITTEKSIPTFPTRTKRTSSTKPKHAHKTISSVVVKISFLLLPRPAEAKEETSVVKAVEEMAQMVNAKRFKIIVKNTRISVVGVVNESEPFSMSSSCKQGVINAYDDQHFKLAVSENPISKENATVVYINETGNLYWPGWYDLILLMQGSLMDSTKLLHNVSGYVLVCTMPKIMDSSCARFLLQKHEYTVVNHDKAIVDIYTKTQRSIYEYRYVSNDSVEICMPNMADKSCGRIKLSPSEYEMLSNKSIIYAGELYNIFQYETSGNESVEICIPRNYFEDNTDANITDHVTGCDLADYTGWLKAEGYLTTTLSLISICSMVVVLVTYCLFAKLRNLPGTNTMNLTLALLIAEMVFELGSSSDIYGVCVTVGIVLHFFFLASFFWMNVMAYDVYQTFANSCVLTRVRSKSKYLPKYALYAWGSPVILVALCCFIDFARVFKSIHIGYGPVNQDKLVKVTNHTEGVMNETTTYAHYSSRQQLGCWIQEPMAALAAFGGPILLILFANAVFYVKAIICIRATTRSSLKITRRSTNRRLTGQNDVIIYVRMSTVMGFTWIIGFTSSFISSVASDGGAVVCLVLNILTILFTLFNLSQGFLIFFVFVFNRRVGLLYKQFVLKKWIACKKFLNRENGLSPNHHKTTISKISETVTFKVT